MNIKVLNSLFFDEGSAIALIIKISTCLFICRAVYWIK